MLNLFNNWQRPEGKGIVLMGSCFSDNLKPYLEQEGYEVSSNVFGTLFHPIPIFNWLKYACAKDISDSEMQLIFHEEKWKSLGGGKKLRADSIEELKGIIHKNLNTLHQSLELAKTLVLTLGTAHAWMHRDFGLVGNCQRLPQQDFQQEIISLNEMVKVGGESIELLHKMNPYLNVVFTVSPVRHWRMGVAENARTKARCVELAHALCEKYALKYFPSYEFVIDILRNDEYFEEDRCHPNEMAIQKVVDCFLKKDERTLMMTRE